MKSAPILCAAALMLATCGAAAANPFAGVYGAKGNDTGGIIPWSPQNERVAYDIAQAQCGAFNKYAHPVAIERVYGGYMSYRCLWNPPRRR